MKKLLAIVGLIVLSLQIAFAQGAVSGDGDFGIYAQRTAVDTLEVRINDPMEGSDDYFVDCNLYPSGDDRFAQTKGEPVVFKGLSEKGIYVCSATAQTLDSWVRYSNRSVVIPVLMDADGNFFDDNPFSDVNLDSWEGKAIRDLYHRGVVSGNPDGTFGGSRRVNRVEAAKMLILGYAQFKDIPSPDGKIGFDDIGGGEWYFPVVLDAVNMGFMKGYGDNTFGPEKDINTAEFLKMMVELYGLETGLQHGYKDVPEGVWYEKYAGAAKKYDLFPKRRDELQPAARLTRNEVAVAIHRYLLFKNGN